ncbi:MAG: hypothetical protein NC299_12695 [Lachnospiraceae bacterium]|nr:hypothetical protein [Ruminococcus sp.]MCM1276198.1 hypothetical protein [Lachnospiraceae bacterium]
MSDKYSLCESRAYFGCLDGRLRSPLFGREIEFLVKGNDEIYARRCAEYFEKITAENLAEYPVLNALFGALGEYVVDLLDERGDELELGDFTYDEGSSVADLLKALTPAALTFERSPYHSEEECPIAFGVKLGFDPIADEYMEIVMRGVTAVYAGEYRGVSPWNDKILKKKWNYARGI